MSICARSAAGVPLSIATARRQIDIGRELFPRRASMQKLAAVTLIVIENSWGVRSGPCRPRTPSPASLRATSHGQVLVVLKKGAGAAPRADLRRAARRRTPQRQLGCPPFEPTSSAVKSLKFHDLGRELEGQQRGRPHQRMRSGRSPSHHLDRGGAVRSSTQRGQAEDEWSTATYPEG